MNTKYNTLNDYLDTDRDKAINMLKTDKTLSMGTLTKEQINSLFNKEEPKSASLSTLFNPLKPPEKVSNKEEFILKALLNNTSNQPNNLIYGLFTDGNLLNSFNTTLNAIEEEIRNL